MTIIGIDPGITGAIAVLNGDAAAVYDIPTFMTRGKRGKRTQYDYGECLRWCTGIASFAHPTRIFLEDVRAHIHRPPAGAKACPACKRPFGEHRDSSLVAQSIGESRGMWLTVAAALNLPIELVPASTWKRAWGLWGKDKEASRALACRQFPGIAEQLSRKKDHNRAEALLIAAWGRRTQGACT